MSVDYQRRSSLRYGAAALMAAILVLGYPAASSLAFSNVGDHLEIIDAGNDVVVGKIEGDNNRFAIADLPAENMALNLVGDLDAAESVRCGPGRAAQRQI